MASKTLTVIVPAYNEENRIVSFLSDLEAFKKKNHVLKEILVVNDGSTDKTLKKLEVFGKRIRIISYKTNKGKGYAVKKGLLAAKSDFVVFMDADGSTSPSELPKMIEALKKYEFVTGTRASKKSKIIRKQPFQRIIAGKVFNRLVLIIFNTGINDSLCGFKGFRKETGRKIAKKLVSERWIFDVELFARAKKEGIEIGVIPITWKHVGEAKMILGISNVKMFVGLLKLKAILVSEK